LDDEMDKFLRHKISLTQEQVDTPIFIKEIGIKEVGKCFPERELQAQIVACTGEFYQIFMDEISSILLKFLQIIEQEQMCDNSSSETRIIITKPNRH
jgi:hypothetical protein